MKQRFLIGLLALNLLSSTASALTVQCINSDSYLQENILISGSIKPQSYPDIPLGRNPRIFFSSKGGTPSESVPVVNWLTREIAASGVKPTVVLHESCDSSCITVLAGLNNLAGRGIIDLILDESLKIGFHGCYNTTKEEFAKDCNMKFIADQVVYGVNPIWVRQNNNLYARPYKQYIVPVSVRDPRLDGSGLINHARIMRNTKRWTQLK